MTTTVTAPTIDVGNATLTLAPLDSFTESWRHDALGAIGAVLAGQMIDNITGPTTVYGDPASLLPYWDIVITDIDGLDDPTRINGYHGVTFTCDRTTPVSRLRAMANMAGDPHRENAARVLASLSTRVYAQRLSDHLRGV